MISTSRFAARIDPTCLVVHAIAKSPTIVLECRESEDMVSCAGDIGWSWSLVSASCANAGNGVQHWEDMRMPREAGQIELTSQHASPAAEMVLARQAIVFLIGSGAGRLIR